MTDVVDNDHAEDVGADQTERLGSRTAKVVAINSGQNERVAIEELQKAFQTPEAAFTAAHDVLGYLVLLAGGGLELAVDVLERHADHFDDGDEQRAERQSAKVVEDGAQERAEHGEHGQLVLVFLVDVGEAGPVEGAECARDRHLVQADVEGREPEEHEQDKDLW